MKRNILALSAALALAFIPCTANYKYSCIHAFSAENDTNSTAPEYTVEQLDNGINLLTAVKTNSQDIVIPETVNGIKINGLKTELFAGNQDIRSVVLPDTITYFGSSVFANSSVTSVNIPKGLNILPAKTFYNCKQLSELKLHENIIAVANTAFKNSLYTPPQWLTERYALALFESKINDSNVDCESTVNGWVIHIHYDPDHTSGAVLSDDDKYINIRKLPEETDEKKIPRSICGIPVYSYNEQPLNFTGEGTLTKKVVPEQYFSTYYFNDTIPPAYIYLQLHDLKGVNFTFTLKDSSLVELVLSKYNNSSRISLVNCPDLEKVTFDGLFPVLMISKGAYENCTSLKSLEFTNECGNIVIKSDAFRNCGFEKLTVPYNCSTDTNSFSQCSKLTDVIFENDVVIGSISFSECTSLKNVTFKDFTQIAANAFAKCNALENINININEDYPIDPRAFDNCPGLYSINGYKVLDTKSGDFLPEYKDFIFKYFSGAQNVGFINSYISIQVKKIVSETVTDNMTDMQKAKALHDWICDNTTYDFEDNNSDKNHNDASILMNESTVCEGYSRFYNLLLHEAGIESCYVHSSDHAWNIIRLGDHFFHVDTTWDDLNGSYKWFLSSDTELKNEGGSHSSWTLLMPSTLHSFQLSALPACSYSLGDINTDGELNVSDMVTMSNYLHGKKSPKKGDEVLCDLNYDGKYDVFDLISLRKKLISNNNIQ